MEFNSQDKNPLVDMISTKMKLLKMNQEQLSSLTGVSQPVISRLLNKKKPSKNIGIENIYSILNKLDLLKKAEDISGEAALKEAETPFIVSLNLSDDAIKEFPILRYIIAGANEAAANKDVDLLESSIEAALKHIKKPKEIEIRTRHGDRKLAGNDHQ